MTTLADFYTYAISQHPWLFLAGMLAVFAAVNWFAYKLSVWLACRCYRAELDEQARAGVQVGKV